jgi:hypothetical protein
MSRVNLADYGKPQRQKLSPDDIPANECVLTIATAAEVTVGSENGRPLKRIVVSFKETENRALWLNYTQVSTLVERIGDELNAWVGKRVPVQRHVAEYEGAEYPKVRIVPTSTWDGVMQRAGKAKRATKARR